MTDLHRARPKRLSGGETRALRRTQLGTIPNKIAYFPLFVGIAAGALLLLLGWRMVHNEETNVTAQLGRAAKEAARDLSRRVEVALDEDASSFSALGASRAPQGPLPSCSVSTPVHRADEGAKSEGSESARDASSAKEDGTCKALAWSLPSDTGDTRKATVDHLVATCPLVRGAVGTLLVPGLLAEARNESELRRWLSEHRDALASSDRRYLHTLLSDSAFDAPVRAALLLLLHRGGEKNGGADLADRALAAHVHAFFRETPSRGARTLRGDTTIARTLPSEGGKAAVIAVLDADELVRCAGQRLSLSPDLELRIVDVQERDRETTVRLAPELVLEVVLRGPEVVRERTRKTKVLFGSLFGLAVALGGSLTAFVAWKGRRAEELAELRTDFAAAIAHELRTPLTSMRVLAELLAEGSLSADDHRVAAQNLLEQTERLSATAERMLTLRSLMVGKRAIALRPTLLAELLETATQDFSARFPDAHVGRDFAKEAEGKTDASLLRLIVDNLMDNASKYAGGLKEVYLRAVGECWEIGVVDEGPGVPDAMKQKLFEPFERAEARLSEETKGAGLGLALVRYAADAIGAEVGILDADPKGAIFYVRIPRRPEAVRTVSDEEGA